MSATATAETRLATVAPRVSAKRIARYARTGGRVLFGLLFFVCGLDYFFHFFPQPTAPMSPGAMAFAGGLFGTGYMFPLIKGTEILAGALLLSNRFVPLALALLAPVVVNIFLFHAFLAPEGVALASLILATELALAWSYRRAYLPMLAAKSV